MPPKPPTRNNAARSADRSATGRETRAAAAHAVASEAIQEAVDTSGEVSAPYGKTCDVQKLLQSLAEGTEAAFSRTNAQVLHMER